MPLSRLEKRMLHSNSNFGSEPLQLQGGKEICNLQPVEMVDPSPGEEGLVNNVIDDSCGCSRHPESARQED